MTFPKIFILSFSVDYTEFYAVSKIAARVNDQETIKNLVAHGIGVSVISERAAQNFVEEGRLLQFNLPDCNAERDLYLVYRKDHVLKGNVQKFIEYLKAYYQ